MAEEIYRLVYEAPSNEDIPAVEMPPSKSVMARLLLIGCRGAACATDGWRSAVMR